MRSHFFRINFMEYYLHKQIVPFYKRIISVYLLILNAKFINNI